MLKVEKRYEVVKVEWERKGESTWTRQTPCSSQTALRVICIHTPSEKS